MSLSHRGNTDDFDAWSDECPDEDPSTAWVRRQVDLTLDQYYSEPMSVSHSRLAPIAVTLCVALFLILLITLALVAQR